MIALDFITDSILGIAGGVEPAGAAWTRERIEQKIFRERGLAVIATDALAAHDARLRGAGIDGALLRELFDNSNRDHAAGHPQDGDLVSGYPKISNRFQQEIVTSGRFALRSPVDGAVVAASTGLPISVNGAVPSVIYEFDGAAPFVVGAGRGWLGSLSFVWFVTKDILVTDTIAQSDWNTIEDCVGTYVERCLCNLDDVRAYRAAAKRVALATGFISNMGHYFWNEVSGTERIIRLATLANVDMVYYQPDVWLDMNEIMAGEDGATFAAVDTSEDLFALALRNSHLVIRPTGTQIDRALADKVIAAARARLRRLHPGRVEALAAAQADAAYVVFANLRTHNKMWVEQVPGIVAFAREVARQRGRTTVFLDGYGDCADVAREIAGHAIEGVSFVDGTAVPFPETLLWAQRCDFFLAVIGSGLVPLTWLCDRPGIAHGDGGHYGQLGWWPDVGGGASPLLAPPPSAIIDRAQAFYADYSLSLDVVCALFRHYSREPS